MSNKLLPYHINHVKSYKQIINRISISPDDLLNNYDTKLDKLSLDWYKI